ncbi:MAG: hypothetical protein EZS28_036646 [Streblomastix strix]|uniref:Uncharacterized protein n=1 Tax=Streblomastix strix TaxID=222440 RepID=A0A5J4UB92_9EUKA|nr:MAG: hypothetical protein EZS28_036646 [Streblomastix strix]
MKTNPRTKFISHYQKQLIIEIISTKQEGNDELINEGECTCSEGHHPYGCLCKDSDDFNCICPSNSGIGCTCRWNVSQTTTGDNIKSTIQAVIDLTCDNYEIQLIDSLYTESVNISKQGTYLIKGSQTIEEQAQTILSLDYYFGQMIELNQGYLTIEIIDFQYSIAENSYPMESPSYPMIYINGDQSPYPSLTINHCNFKDIRPHCIEITTPCNQTTPAQLIDLSTDICECYLVGDPRIECSESKACDDGSADLSNIPPTLCSCNGDDDPRAGITCPVITECTDGSIYPKCLCTSELQSPGFQIHYSHLIFVQLQRHVQDHQVMMNKSMKDNAHVMKDIIHLVAFVKIIMILIASVLQILDLFAHVDGT